MMAKGETVKTSDQGFTIVEFLVIVVVVVILSAIMLVAYDLVLKNTNSSSLQSNLKNAAKQLNVDQVRSSDGKFPATLSAANNGGGINFSSDQTVSYVVNNTDTPKTFCLTTTKNNQSYFITQEGTPLPGPCPNLYLDTRALTSYPGTGLSWYDLSGNGLNGSGNAGITYSSSLKALSLNGTSNYFTVPASSNTNPSTNGTFSISAWVRPDTLSSTWYRGIIVQETYLTSGYRFGIYLDGRVGFWTTQSGGTLSLLTTSNNVVANQWTNIVATYDAQNAKVYINGVLSGSASGTYISGNNNVYIGLIISEYFSGAMSEIRFYNNKALTQDEVTASFKALKFNYGL